MFENKVLCLNKEVQYYTAGTDMDKVQHFEYSISINKSILQNRQYLDNIYRPCIPHSAFILSILSGSGEQTESGRKIIPRLRQ